MIQKCNLCHQGINQKKIVAAFILIWKFYYCCKAYEYLLVNLYCPSMGRP